jgi:hypothetical protein
MADMAKDDSGVIQFICRTGKNTPAVVSRRARRAGSPRRCISPVWIFDSLPAERPLDVADWFAFISKHHSPSCACGIQIRGPAPRDMCGRYPHIGRTTSCRRSGMNITSCGYQVHFCEICHAVLLRTGLERNGFSAPRLGATGVPRQAHPRRPLTGRVNEKVLTPLHALALESQAALAY